MLKKWGVLLLGALVASAVLIVGANAVTVPATTPSLDLSSRAAVMKYLASHGIDSKKILIQRGARNYAGPHCPGKGWTCTTSKRVVQISYAINVSQFVCTPSTGGFASAPDSCEIVQFSTGAANNASCIERTGSASVVQSCLIYQTNTTGTNTASIAQQVDTATGATQLATQYSGIQQDNDAGSNNATVVQTLAQLATTTAPGGTQTQNGHQTVSVLQHANTGANWANVTQTLALTERIANLPAVFQNQNTDGTLGPNTAASIRQTSASGVNTGTLTQTHDLNASVSYATTANQQQGSLTGGLLGHFEQTSTGISNANATQRENQRLNADHVGTLMQTQFGPMWTGSPQGSNPADRYSILQVSSQNASSPAAMQDDKQYANCDSSGGCSALEVITQDGQSHVNTCSGPSCRIGQTVTQAIGGTTTTTCTGFSTEPGPGTCPTPPAPPAPPPSIVPA